MLVWYNTISEILAFLHYAQEWKQMKPGHGHTTKTRTGACVRQQKLQNTGNWTTYTGTKTNKEKTSGMQHTLWNIENHKIYTETKINEEWSM